MLQQLTNELLQALDRGDPRLIAALVVLGSLLLYNAASNFAWYYRAAPYRLPGPMERYITSNLVRILYEFMRLFYYVAVPYVALLFGWVDVRALGFAALDWANGLRWTVVLALATWSLLMFVWVPYLRATTDVPLGLSREVLSWSRRVIEVVYMQAHWAFYRAACILILTSFLNDETAAYWGTCIGLTLVAVEAWSDPRVRRHIAHVGEGELTLWGACQAIINTVGFVLTRNIWLLALLHLGLEFTVPHLRAAPRPAWSGLPAPTAATGRASAPGNKPGAPQPPPPLPRRSGG